MTAIAAKAIVVVMSLVIVFRIFMHSPSVNNLVKSERHSCAPLLRRKREEKTIIGDRITLCDGPSRGTPAVSRFAHCTMRHMRDLRRYSVPVTINNPKQVNIASVSFSLET
jgi:hypothetical protein